MFLTLVAVKKNKEEWKSEWEPLCLSQVISLCGVCSESLLLRLFVLTKQNSLVILRVFSLFSRSRFSPASNPSALTRVLRSLDRQTQARFYEGWIRVIVFACWK